MRTLRRRLMTTYANLDLPIKWKDGQVAAWASGKGYVTRRDCMAVRGIASADFRGNTELRSFAELKWFTGLVDFGNGTFQDCTALEEIAIPQGVKVLYGQVFRNCAKLRNITLPSSVQQMNGYVFLNCTSMKWAKVLAATPPKLDTGMPTFSATGCEFYVPDDSVETYKAATGWSKMADRIHPMSEWVDE